jgi:hypothetical protein
MSDTASLRKSAERLHAAGGFERLDHAISPR